MQKMQPPAKLHYGPSKVKLGKLKRSEKENIQGRAGVGS